MEPLREPSEDSDRESLPSPLPSPDLSAHDEEEEEEDQLDDSMDDPSEESEREATLSAASSPARSTSSGADSLAGEPASEIERVALDFISNPPLSHSDQLKELGGGLDAFDLPRPPTSSLTRDEMMELEKKAIEFLKKKVADADQDDWMYPTPAVFGPPKPLGLRNAPGMGGTGGGMGGPQRGREGEEGVGWDDKDGNGSEWIDRAFNLERYQVEGLSGTMNELDLATTNEPQLVEDWQGGTSFGDNVDDGGYSFTG
ncbi:uncharacterized protein JCM6883_003414 [Sporobolomyces salmoneus]|uniref:uncharacterized protein n=1 Tax=Sporobolomyces salmoneus TaxID=183962 RepID=UPI0031774AE4